MVTLFIRGRPMQFDEEDLIRLIEGHLCLGPIEGKWFKVNPRKIKWSLFANPRENPNQEEARKRIMNVYSIIIEENLYTEPFEILIPPKAWKVLSISELVEYASMIGDCIADVDDQALVWAQRLTNGETWEEVCNNVDNLPWFRLIEFKSGIYRLVGGSVVERYRYSSTSISERDYNIRDGLIENAVPLIRRKIVN